MTFSCKHAARLVSESMDRPLSRRERFSLGFHLLVCGLCRRYRRQLRLMRRLLRDEAHLNSTSVLIEDFAAMTTLSPEARQRISRALGNQP
jgi:hypothetical protein